MLSYFVAVFLTSTLSAYGIWSSVYVGVVIVLLKKVHKSPIVATELAIGSISLTEKFCYYISVAFFLNQS